MCVCVTKNDWTSSSQGLRFWLLYIYIHTNIAQKKHNYPKCQRADVQRKECKFRTKTFIKNKTCYVNCCFNVVMGPCRSHEYIVWPWNLKVSRSLQENCTARKIQKFPLLFRMGFGALNQLLQVTGMPWATYGIHQTQSEHSLLKRSCTSYGCSR